MKQRIGATFLALSMAFALAAGPLSASAVDIPRGRTYIPGQFYDVPDTAWYAEAVKDCYEMGLMSGTSDASFDPSGMFTLAQALTVAGRLHSLYHGGNGVIPGVSGDWREDAANYAIQNGIASIAQFYGCDYEDDVTRAQMAGLMAAALPGSALTAINSVTALPDVSSSTSYSSEIFALYDAGIFTGSDEYGSFQPYAFITRAEVAAIVARCADPAQRAALSLTPMSLIDAPEIPNFEKPSSYSNEFGMSEGLLRVQNTTDNQGRLYGYMNYRGELVIPYQYTAAKDFSNGLAIVRGQNGEGVINTDGMTVVPLMYNSVHDNGFYFIASTRTDCTFYSYQGAYLGYFDGWSAYDFDDVQDLKYEDNNPLLVLEDGRKKALATPEGPITEAVYDFIELIDNSNFAVLKVGEMEALAGPNGIIFNLGEYIYTTETAIGNYAVVRRYDYPAVDEWAISDVTGNLTEFLRPYSFLSDLYVSDGMVIAYSSDYGQYILYDRVTGDTLTYSVKEGEISSGNKGDFYGGAGHIPLSDGTYLLLDGTKCLSVENSGVYDSKHFHEYWVYQGLNGKYGIAHEGKQMTGSIYASPEDAIASYGYYKIADISGKPAVVFGNDGSGFTPVIQFYQNGIPYDQIVALGEDFYACRFNQTWYLVHA